MLFRFLPLLKTVTLTVLRPQRLAEFIGQEKVKETLSIAIEAAQKRREPLDHLLFHGPARGSWRSALAPLTTSGPPADPWHELSSDRPRPWFPTSRSRTERNQAYSTPGPAAPTQQPTNTARLEDAIRSSAHARPPFTFYNHREPWNRTFGSARAGP